MLDLIGKTTPPELKEYDGIVYPDYEVRFPTLSSRFFFILSFQDCPCFKEGAVLPDGTPPTASEQKKAPSLATISLKRKTELSSDDSGDELPPKIVT
jgi:hypothetical protein